MPTSEHLIPRKNPSFLFIFAGNPPLFPPRQRDRFSLPFLHSALARPHHLASPPSWLLQNQSFFGLFPPLFSSANSASTYWFSPAEVSPFIPRFCQVQIPAGVSFFPPGSGERVKKTYAPYFEKTGPLRRYVPNIIGFFPRHLGLFRRLPRPPSNDPLFVLPSGVGGRRYPGSQKAPPAGLPSFLSG